MRSYGAAAGEVLGAVVDHLVGSARAHEVELGGVVDAGHMDAGGRGQLQRERARAAAGAVDQHPAARRRPRDRLHGDRARLRQRRRLGERQLGGLERERMLGSHGVLGEAAGHA